MEFTFYERRRDYSTNEPGINFCKNSITFNTSCYDFLKNTPYMEIAVSEDYKYVFFRLSTCKNAAALRLTFIKRNAQLNNTKNVQKFLNINITSTLRFSTTFDKELNGFLVNLTKPVKKKILLK